MAKVRWFSNIEVEPVLKSKSISSLPSFSFKRAPLTEIPLSSSPNFPALENLAWKSLSVFGNKTIAIGYKVHCSDCDHVCSALLKVQPTSSLNLLDFLKKEILGTALDGDIRPHPVTAAPVG